MKKNIKLKVINFLKKWKKLLLFFLIYIAVTATIFYTLKATGVLSSESILDLMREHETITLLLFLGIRTVSVIFFSFIPGISLIFETVAMVMWGATFKCFVIVYLSLIISSLIQDVIGRFGGSKLVEKLLGKASYEKASDLLATKGLVYVPFIYLFPLFPDEAVCMLTGSTKIKWWIHLIYILIFRGIGTATLICSVGLLPEGVKTFTDPNPINYIRIIVWFGMSVAFLFTWTRKLDKYLTKLFSKFNKIKSSK